MAEQKEDGIAWCDFTFNPWIGCMKVSEGCKFCYAERDFDKRRHVAVWGDNGTRVMTSTDYWKKPIAWNKKVAVTCNACGNRMILNPGIANGVHRFNCGKGGCESRDYTIGRPRVFCASLADLFEDWKGPIMNSSGRELWMDHRGPFIRGENYRGDGKPMTMDHVRAGLFKLIDATQNLDWMLLTKRPENINGMIPCGPHVKRYDGLAWYRKNLWLGTSVENQEQADKRMPHLLKCADMASIIFLSCEPLLGPVDLTRVEVPQEFDKLRKPWSVEGSKFNSLQEQDEDCFHGAPAIIDWVIVGGESGPNARPMHPDWAESIRDQCKAAGVPFLFKQWGEWSSKIPSEQMIDTESSSIVVGKNQMLMESGIRPGRTLLTRYGTKKAGRLLDGVLHHEFPVSNPVGTES